MCLLGKGGLPRQTLESPSLEILKKKQKRKENKKNQLDTALSNLLR